MQELKAAPSRLHWKTAPSSEEKLKLAVAVVIVPEGPASICVSGGVESSM